MKSYEVNFDGIVGTTHNYSGLSYGNVASMKNVKAVSNPKAAALQGLEKMNHLRQMGIKQAVLPPQERPHIPTLRNLGFQGSDPAILKQVLHQEPSLLADCSSAAAMWAANAATMTPSTDAQDGKMHITTANLASKFHRSIEAQTTYNVLNTLFANSYYFRNHTPLPSGSFFADEGAANHTRFCLEYGKPGIHLFVYGRHAFQKSKYPSKKFPTRQTFEASESIVRLHQLDPHQVIFAQQNPKAIDQGVFHNDVISVGNLNFFFYHEQAFVNTSSVIAEIRQKFFKQTGADMIFLKVPESKISLKEAVKSYLFNSQIVEIPDKSIALIAPEECRSIPSVHQFLEEMITSSKNPVSQIHYFKLHESMRNGGGPACLRLRIVLSEEELGAVHPHVFLNDSLYQSLKLWIEKHYRDRLIPSDLADPQLLEETRQALDSLTKILKLGSVYDFQK
jgi:succinylarginine dihydrolase